MTEIADTKLNLLLVDDQQTNIKILADALKEEYNLRFATSGPEALEILKNGELPDLILLDVMMPDMDGFTVCSKLKQDPRTEDIPVIFVTAMDDEGNEQHGLEVGAVDYISKPVSAPIVRARVALHLELRQHREFLQKLLDMRTSDLEEAQQEAQALIEFIRQQIL